MKHMKIGKWSNCWGSSLEKRDILFIFPKLWEANINKSSNNSATPNILVQKYFRHASFCVEFFFLGLNWN